MRKGLYRINWQNNCNLGCMNTFGKLLFILILTTGFSAVSKAQLLFDKVSHDFEDVYANDDYFTDFVVKNSGNKKAFILTVKNPREVTFLFSNEMILPDSSIVFRLHVNPKSLGKFKYEVELFSTDKTAPTTIKLTGNLKEFQENSYASMQACPNFTARPTKTALDFKLTVVTIDEDTKQVLSASNVSLLQNGIPLGSWKTDKNGQIIKKVPLGYTYFFATHEGYFPGEFGRYVNAQRNYVEIPLKKDLTTPVQTPEDHFIVLEEREPLAEVEIILEQPMPTLKEQLEKIPVEITEKQSNLELSNIPFENFDEAHFKPVNVVFVLDISTSMVVGDKLELMKYSLYQLADYLRPQDKIGIVTYSSTTKLLLPSTSAQYKETIKKPVEKLKPGGNTAGGDGIKMGFSEASKSIISNGANMVIIITDGAFNKNSDDYLKAIEKYKSEGIIFSVVGIHNAPKDELKMKEAAAAGNGRYVPIFKLADAQQNLIREIRMSAYRK